MKEPDDALPGRTAEPILVHVAVGIDRLAANRVA
jgi:hypothetical protein